MKSLKQTRKFNILLNCMGTLPKKMMVEYRVEKHFIRPNTPAWAECDTLCFKSKNLYNQGLYRIRQHFFESSNYLGYSSIQKQLQDERHECYVDLKAKVSQAILKDLDRSFKSFFSSLKSWKKDPSRFLGKPKIPRYKPKDGRHQVTFTNQAISRKRLKEGFLHLSGTNFEIKLHKSQKHKIKEVTITPKDEGFLVLVKYEIPKPSKMVENNLIAGVDLGVNNLAAVAANVKGSEPLLINGRPLKSINQYFNKRLAELRGQLDTIQSNRGRKRLKKKLKSLCGKRNRKVDDYLHKASRMLVNRLVSLGVTHLVVGKNAGWKQEINIGKRNNQNFVQIPHARFIEMLRYKWEHEGGRFTETDEAYTSKCSFLDGEYPGKRDEYVGKRVKRGLFRSSLGHLVNADVNGAANIILKVVREGFRSWSVPDLIEGFVVSPVRLTADHL